MPIGAPKDLNLIRRFFLEPQTPRQRQYEALRAYFIEGLPAWKAAQTFGYSVSAFHVLCHHFRRDPAPVFFVTPRRGPRTQPKKSAARDLIVQLRKRLAAAKTDADRSRITAKLQKLAILSPGQPLLK